MPISNLGGILDKQIGEAICERPASNLGAVDAGAEGNLSLGVSALLLTPILLR